MTAIQPRRRPQNPGTNRSMNGDQRILNAQGICARLKRPTIRMSTPMSRIQSGMAYQTSPSGRPEENESATTESTRRERRPASAAESRVMALSGGPPGGR